MEGSESFRRNKRAPNGSAVQPARREGISGGGRLLTPPSTWRSRSRRRCGARSGARSRRRCGRLLGDRLEIHPIHAPEMAIEILETTAIHEVVVVLRRRIDHAAGTLGLADEIVDLSAAVS